jgi:hypothetical protein
MRSRSFGLIAVGVGCLKFLALLLTTQPNRRQVATKSRCKPHQPPIVSPDYIFQLGANKLKLSTIESRRIVGRARERGFSDTCTYRRGRAFLVNLHDDGETALSLAVRSRPVGKPLVRPWGLIHDSHAIAECVAMRKKNNHRSPPSSLQIDHSCSGWAREGAGIAAGACQYPHSREEQLSRWLELFENCLR